MEECKSYKFLVSLVIRLHPLKPYESEVITQKSELSLNYTDNISNPLSLGAESAPSEPNTSLIPCSVLRLVATAFWPWHADIISKKQCEMNMSLRLPGAVRAAGFVSLFHSIPLVNRSFERLSEPALNSPLARTNHSTSAPEGPRWFLNAAIYRSLRAPRWRFGAHRRS